MPAALTRTVSVRVPAKVNLMLGVGDVRPDGYHELQTVFHAVDLYDEVSATAATQLSLTVSGDDTDDVPLDASNVACRAAELLAASAGIAPDVRLHLTKAIPVAGGMAGGSADGAAALLACARLWDLDDSPAALLPLAAQLGSDVAFPLLGGTAVGTGRGEVLTPVPTAGTLHWVFALAGHGLSTVAAYRMLDAMRVEGSAPPAVAGPERLVAALADGDVAAVAASLANDMQPASLRIAPTLQATLDAGLDAGALSGIVSGSGPTCAFLCADAEAAQALAEKLEAAGVCHRARVAQGPVAGATVVDGSGL